MRLVSATGWRLAASGPAPSAPWRGALRKRKTPRMPSRRRNRAAVPCMTDLLRKNELVLCGQPQVIRVAAVSNDDLPGADKQIPAIETIVDDHQTTFAARGCTIVFIIVLSFFFVRACVHLDTVQMSSMYSSIILGTL